MELIMSKLRIFLLSLIVVGSLVPLGAADKKKNKLKVKPTEKKELNEKKESKEQDGKTLIDLPLFDILPQILSYIPNDLGSVVRVSKDFRNVIYEQDKQGNLTLRDIFLNALLFHRHVVQGRERKQLSQQEKMKKFWEFVARTGYTKALDNFEEVIDEDLYVNEILDEKTKERPIHILAEYASVNTLDYFFKTFQEDDEKIKTKAKTADGKNALDIAVIKENIQAIQVFEEKNLDCSEYFVEECSLEESKDFLLKQERRLFNAARKGDREKIEDFYEDDKSIVYTKDLKGWSLLHVAAKSGKVETIQYLVKLKAKLESRAKNDWTPLHVAVRYGRIKAIKKLVALGARLDAQAKDGWTLLHIAARYSQVKAIDTLVTLGVPVDVEDKNGRTPLHVAAWYGNVQAIQKLCKLGASLEEPDNQDCTPLHMAAAYDKIEAIEKLVKLNAKLESRDIYGFTPLHMAAKCGNTEAIETLVELKAKIRAKVKKGRRAGKTALDLYERFCKKEGIMINTDVVKLLS